MLRKENTSPDFGALSGHFQCSKCLESLKCFPFGDMRKVLGIRRDEEEEEEGCACVCVCEIELNNCLDNGILPLNHLLINLLNTSYVLGAVLGTGDTT